VAGVHGDCGLTRISNADLSTFSHIKNLFKFAVDNASMSNRTFYLGRRNGADEKWESAARSLREFRGGGDAAAAGYGRGAAGEIGAEGVARSHGARRARSLRQRLSRRPLNSSAAAPFALISYAGEEREER